MKLRALVLRAAVILGVVVAALIEILSPFHLLRPVPLAAAWAILLAAALVWIRRRPIHWERPTFRWPEATVVIAIIAIAAVVGLTAVLSPPNSADAMAYHMPRVVYWTQQGGVAFFPTPYFNQITLQPLAEYFMLHSYVISGGDHLVNLVAFLAFLGSIVAVSAIAGAMGLGTAAQAFAALFCATLPNAILQASGAKNDSLLALWLAAMVYFALRRNAAFMGLALGLALATKATAYLFAPPMLAAVLLWTFGEDRRLPWKSLAAWTAAGVLILNDPQYLRNLALSGSPLGYDSAQGDGVFRWRNEHPGVASTVSNLLRHTSEQMGERNPRWNQAVYAAVVGIHRSLRLDPQDPGTTWPGSVYAPPVNANHEANANNRWHLLLAVAGALAAIRRRAWMLYTAGLVTALLAFCFYLKWQPFLARLELPLFVLSAPLAAFLVKRIGNRWIASLICLFLLSNARLPLLKNWTRPLLGPHNLFQTARDESYFNDMGQWNNRDSYLQAVDMTARSGCRLVGIDISRNQLEYPFQALLRERIPDVQFVHAGVVNASARYYPLVPPQPCAVFCPDCAGLPEKTILYSNFGAPATIGHFLLFLRAEIR